MNNVYSMIYRMKNTHTYASVTVSLPFEFYLFCVPVAEGAEEIEPQLNCVLFNHFY